METIEFDPETLVVAFAALEAAFKDLPTERQTQSTRNHMMTAVLLAARNGERDQSRLAAIAAEASL